MLIYFGVILFCFLLSTIKLPKAIENLALLIIAFFVCSGYMTGSDWYNYEQYYSNPEYSKQLDKLEIGYIFLQTLISKLGVDFWVFHIIVKLLVFYSFVNFVRWFNINIFLFLTFFIPETGLYLFIDCPFRNMIALGFALIAFRKMLDNKTFSFIIFTLIALSFHMSSLILIPIYFVFKKNIKTYLVVITALVIYVVAFNVEFLVSSIYIPLTKISPLISDHLKFYFQDSRYISDKVGLGVFIRLFILIIMLLFKEKIIAGENKRQYVYNLSILFLLMYPFGLTMKIFHRFSIFLIPFYIISIVFLVTSLRLKMNKLFLYSFFILLYLKQTYSLVTYDYRYIPYTNYVFYWVKNDFPNIEYRHEYNPKHSPYKKQIQQK